MEELDVLSAKIEEIILKKLQEILLEKALFVKFSNYGLFNTLVTAVNSFDSLEYEEETISSSLKLLKLS